MSDNPFASPQSEAFADFHSGFHGNELAGRFTRFAAVLVDGIIMSCVFLPVQFATGYFQRAQTLELGILEQLGMLFFGHAVMLVFNGYLLVTRGQTIGKFLTGIQIVNYRTGGLLPFTRVFLFRYLWLMPLSLIVLVIPGFFDDYLVGLVSIVDALLIFGPERRCLHDYIAGSKVVRYAEGRSKTGV